MNTITTIDCINACNSLLRGELAAIDTYGQALEKFAGKPQAGALARLRATHGQHARVLRLQVFTMGGNPSPTAGAWGTFAQAVEGTAKIFGCSATLQALIEGEVKGLEDYDEALKDEEVPDDLKSALHAQFIPNLRNNVSTLQHLQASL